MMCLNESNYFVFLQYVMFYIAYDTLAKTALISLYIYSSDSLVLLIYSYKFGP